MAGRVSPDRARGGTTGRYGAGRSGGHRLCRRKLCGNRPVRQYRARGRGRRRRRPASCHRQSRAHGSRTRSRCRQRHDHRRGGLYSRRRATGRGRCRPVFPVDACLARSLSDRRQSGYKCRRAERRALWQHPRSGAGPGSGARGRAYLEQSHRAAQGQQRFRSGRPVHRQRRRAGHHHRCGDEALRAGGTAGQCAVRAGVPGPGGTTAAAADRGLGA